MPGHPPLPPSEGQPRLVVFGSAGWVNNQVMAGRGGSSYLDLFTSGLGWLRERRDLGAAAQGKDRPEYAAGLNDLARLYEAMGNYQQAEALYLRARDIRRQAFGEVDADVAHAGRMRGLSAR